MSGRLGVYRPLVAIFAIFVLLTGISAAVLFARKLGTTPAAVTAFYRGSEQAFTQPRSLAGLLKVALPHLLAIPLTLFVVIHLVAAAGTLRRRAVAVASGFTFALALAGLLAGAGVRFLWPQLALVKLVAFVGFEALLAWWVGILVTAALAGAWAMPESEPGSASVKPAMRG